MNNLLLLLPVAALAAIVFTSLWKRMQQHANYKKNIDLKVSLEMSDSSRGTRKLSALIFEVQQAADGFVGLRIDQVRVRPKGFTLRGFNKLYFQFPIEQAKNNRLAVSLMGTKQACQHARSNGLQVTVVGYLVVSSTEKVAVRHTFEVASEHISVLQVAV